MTTAIFRPAAAAARLLAHAAVIAFAAMTFSALPAAADIKHDDAKAAVGAFNKVLLGTMKNGGKLGYKGRYAKLEPAVERAYNLDAMAKGALGAGWADLSESEQAAFRKAFAEFSVATYANRFKAHAGEKFAVTGAKDGPRGTVLVLSHIEKAGGDKVNLNYLMRAYDGRWRIVDVFLNGTFSQLATQRAEYGAILKGEGIQVLIDKLDAKTAALGGAGR